LQNLQLAAITVATTIVTTENEEGMFVIMENVGAMCQKLMGPNFEEDFVTQEGAMSREEEETTSREKGFS